MIRSICYILFFIISLVLLTVVILTKTGFLANFIGKFGWEPLLNPPSTHYERMITYHERMDGSVPCGATIFIGDSLTQGLAVSAIAEISVNYGIGSDTSSGVLERLPLYRSINNAKAIVISIGLNDFQSHASSDLIKNYRKILEMLVGDYIVVVNAIMPVDEKVLSIPTINNMKIEEVNSEIKKLANIYDNVVYVSPNELLVDTNGNLKKEFHVGDGVHFGPAGYNIWISVLKDALRKNLGILNVPVALDQRTC